MNGNTLTIIGNLTRDPELRYLQNGTALTKLGMAWNYKSAQGNENVSFFDVTCWGELGVNIANSNLTKGSRVVVVGRLDQNSYETKDGEKRSVVQIIADEVSPSLRWATVNVTKNERPASNTTGGSQDRQNLDSQVESKTEAGDSQLVESGVASSQTGSYDEEPF